MELSFAPMEGVTYSIYRVLHASMFPGADRYMAPFIAPDTEGRFKGSSLREILPENNAGLPLVPQLLVNASAPFLAAARQLAFFAPFAEIMAAYGAESAPVEAIAFYMTARPNRYVGTSAYFDRQLAAIRRHESQFPAGSEALRSVELYLKLRAVDFGLRSLKGRAEGFRVLGKTQMHCLPEAGL